MCTKTQPLFLMYYEMTQSFRQLFLVVPHGLALMHIIYSVHWGRLCVGRDMSEFCYFSYSFPYSIALKGWGRPDTVQPWAWVRAWATHTQCDLHVSSLWESDRDLSLTAATNPHTSSPVLNHEFRPFNVNKLCIFIEIYSSLGECVEHVYFKKTNGCHILLSLWVC